MPSADALLTASLTATTRPEHRQQRRLAAVIDDEQLRALTFSLTDEVLRLTDDARAAERFRAVVAQHGTPTGLPWIDRAALRFGAALAPRLPKFVMPLVRARLIRESNGVVLPADDPAFAHHVARRTGEHFRLNVNVLGEAILSDAEADERLRLVLERIARPDVDHLSVKISAIVANLDVLAFEHSVEAITERLHVIYRAAMVARPPVFVNLDMEEYRDLPLTLAALTRVLDEPEFVTLDAGVVLQAYLPDAHDAADDLCAWATARQARHAGTGGRLKIRIVKGANLAMERIDAEQHDWPQAPYGSKTEVDASFKRLVLRCLDPRWADAVRVGFASHNLFDIAWASELAPAMRERVEFEMLEGMAPAQARAVRAAVGGVLLYAPVARRDDLPASIAYLARRLDENTGEDNFLRSIFSLQVGNAAWSDQRRRFDDAVAAMDSVTTTSRRIQDRRDEPTATDHDDGFRNTADTDWTRSANREWIDEALRTWQPDSQAELVTIRDVDRAVAAAKTAAERWAHAPFSERRELLDAVAHEMERSRGQTLAVMAHTACKTIAEGDPEVSEGIDFARYYAHRTHAIEKRVTHDLTFSPLGVVLVASPWNFPYAIPAGGVLAAVAAGNAVILKPAPEARPVARELVAQLVRAGVPSDLVQLVMTDDDDAGRRLISHEDVDRVVLTGAYETAQLFRSWRPDIDLMGETSGKNSLVITAAADEDLAIKDLVKSAFGHAGQKCSAASLAIIDAALYDDPRFMRRLAHAVRSVRVGPAADLSTMMGPLIGPPSDRLHRALTTLDPGESWLVEPRLVDASTQLWTPGVRVGVVPGSWFHRTECFGPVLGLMRAADLDHAIEIQNAGDFGLTGGLHSLDEREVQRWLAEVEVGNAYVNRQTTGAIVQRQPFGGWKRSSIGCGPKAGGPGYVESFGRWAGGCDGAEDFARTWSEWFQRDHDPSGLESERNILRYRPLPAVDLWVGGGVGDDERRIVELAAATAGVPLRVFDGHVPSDTKWADRVRALGVVSDAQLTAWWNAGVDVDRSPPVRDARVEVARWVREQALSITRHRHGRLLD